MQEDPGKIADNQLDRPIAVPVADLCSRELEKQWRFKRVVPQRP
jgi:hypothetical protein